METSQQQICRLYHLAKGDDIKALDSFIHSSSLNRSYLVKSLLGACAHGRTEIIHYLIRQQNVDISCVEWLKSSLLCAAIRNNREDTLNQLLEYKIDPNVCAPSVKRKDSYVVFSGHQYCKNALEYSLKMQNPSLRIVTSLLEAKAMVHSSTLYVLLSSGVYIHRKRIRRGKSPINPIIKLLLKHKACISSHSLLSSVSCPTVLQLLLNQESSHEQLTGDILYAFCLHHPSSQHDHSVLKVIKTMLTILCRTNDRVLEQLGQKTHMFRRRWQHVLEYIFAVNWKLKVTLNDRHDGSLAFEWSRDPVSYLCDDKKQELTTESPGQTQGVMRLSLAALGSYGYRKNIRACLFYFLKHSSLTPKAKAAPELWNLIFKFNGNEDLIRMFIDSGADPTVALSRLFGLLRQTKYRHSQRQLFVHMKGYVHLLIELGADMERIHPNIFALLGRLMMELEFTNKFNVLRVLDLTASLLSSPFNRSLYISPMILSKSFIWADITHSAYIYNPILPEKVLTLQQAHMDFEQHCTALINGVERTLSMARIIMATGNVYLYTCLFPNMVILVSRTENKAQQAIKTSLLKLLIEYEHTSSINITCDVTASDKIEDQSESSSCHRSSSEQTLDRSAYIYVLQLPVDLLKMVLEYWTFEFTT